MQEHSREGCKLAALLFFFLFLDNLLRRVEGQGWNPQTCRRETEAFRWSFHRTRRQTKTGLCVCRSLYLRPAPGTCRQPCRERCRDW